MSSSRPRPVLPTTLISSLRLGGRCPVFARDSAACLASYSRWSKFIVMLSWGLRKPSSYASWAQVDVLAMAIVSKTLAT